MNNTRIVETLLDPNNGPLTSFIVLSLHLASVMKPERADDIANEVDRAFRSVGWLSERGDSGNEPQRHARK
jgi:hypothetical protein